MNSSDVFRSINPLRMDGMLTRKLTPLAKNQSVCTHWIWSGAVAYAAGWFILDYCIKLAMSERYSLPSSSSVANILCLSWRTPRPLGSRGNKKGLWSFYNSFLPKFHWYWTYRIPSICLASFLLATKGFPQPQYYFTDIVNYLFYLSWLSPNCPAAFCYLPVCHKSHLPWEWRRAAFWKHRLPWQTSQVLPHRQHSSPGEALCRALKALKKTVTAGGSPCTKGGVREQPSGRVHAQEFHTPTMYTAEQGTVRGPPLQLFLLCTSLADFLGTTGPVFKSDP